MADSSSSLSHQLMSYRILLLLLLASPLAQGCNSDVTPAADVEADTSADTATGDTGEDAEGDTVITDTGEDTVIVDVGEDPPPDSVTIDTAQDVPPTDIGEDTTIDTSEDVPPTDTGGDTTTDLGEDAVEDTEDDTGVTPTPDNHRAEAVVCDETRPPTEYLPGPDDGEWPCTQDADCTEGNNGRCSAMPRWGWECTYDDCFDDSGCGDTVCGCGADWGSDANSCYGGNCQLDSDCGENSFCSPSFDTCGYYSGVVAYFCHTPEDECLNDSDCTAEAEGYCMFNSGGDRWVCGYSHCAGK